MILVASQRGGAKQLGVHLLKTEENEHVEVHEVRGFVSEDVVGALKEAQAISLGTRCKQFLFSVSLNPPPRESVSVEVFEGALDKIETRTGLAGQPRVVVFHEKEGRRHAHCVWSRIDADTMTAVNMAHFKSKMRDVSRELHLENGWQMPRGLMNSEARDPRNFTLAEWQQAKRMGGNARDLKEMVQECWAVSDSRAAFEHALSERGLILAKGDRRGHVAVTPVGEVLSVARYAAKKAKEVRAKLGEADTLPNVEDAKAQMARDMGAAFKRHVGEARTQHGEEAARLEARRQEMTAAHIAERQKLDAAQQSRWQQETRERQDRFNGGVRGLWDRITGRHRATQQDNERQAYAALQRDRAQRQALIDAHLRERQVLQANIRDMRQRQADLLQELRAGRPKSPEQQPVKEKTPQPQPAPHPQAQDLVAPRPKESFDRVAEVRASAQPEVPPPLPADRPPPQPEQSATEQLQAQQPAPTQEEARPSPEDRLRQFREGQADDTPRPNRGPEIER